MQRYDWKLTISRNIKILKIVGLWPPSDETYKLDLYTLYSLVSIFLFIYAHNISQLVYIVCFAPNLQAIAGTMFVSFSEMLTMVKTYYAIQNMRILKSLMKTINCDLFQPRNRRQLGIVTPNLAVWGRVSSTLWTMSGGAVFFWATYPIFDGSARNRQLPFLAWYPYNTKVSPLYEITYIYQILSTAYIATATLSIDALIAALNVYIGSQCDILGDEIRHLFECKEPQLKLLSCITHHKEILRFSRNCNYFCNWIVLVQFFTSAASIGITMFHSTAMELFSSEFFSLVSFGSAITVEIFMYCWFGNEVTVKSVKLPNAVFESAWTGASDKLKKDLLFFLLRLQKPIKISALDLFYLSLETFVKILRTSWSYFALLQQVSSKT